MMSFIAKIVGSSSFIPYLIGVVLIVTSYSLGKKEGRLQETKEREQVLLESTLQWQASLDAEQTRVALVQKGLYSKYRVKGDELDAKVANLKEAFKEVPFMSDTSCYPSESIVRELEDLHSIATKLKGPDSSSPAIPVP